MANVKVGINRSKPREEVSRIQAFTLDEKRIISEEYMQGRSAGKIARKHGWNIRSVNNQLERMKLEGATDPNLQDLAKKEFLSDFNKLLERKKATKKLEDAANRLFRKYCEEEKVSLDEAGLLYVGSSEVIGTKEALDRAGNVHPLSYDSTTTRKAKPLEYLMGLIEKLVGINGKINDTYNNIIRAEIELISSNVSEKYTPAEVYAMFFKIGTLFREILPDENAPQFEQLLRSIQIGGGAPMVLTKGKASDIIDITAMDGGNR